MEQEAETLQASSDQVATETETMEEVLSTIPIVDDATGDNDWEDKDDSLKREHVPCFLPRLPPSDGAGNQVRYSGSRQRLPFVAGGLVQLLSRRVGKSGLATSRPPSISCQLRQHKDGVFVCLSR